MSRCIVTELSIHEYISTSFQPKSSAYSWATNTPILRGPWDHKFDLGLIPARYSEVS